MFWPRTLNLGLETLNLFKWQHPPSPLHRRFCSAGFSTAVGSVRISAADSSSKLPKEYFMKQVLLSALAFAALCAATATCASAQTKTAASTDSPSPVINRSGAPADVDRIIRTMMQKETLFRKALNEYEFRRDAVIQTLGWGGQISGEYHRTSRFVFDDSGNRYEKILFFP